MSQRLISLSPALKRLRDEGLGVRVRAGCLVVHPVPYLTASGTVSTGTLVVRLNLASDDKLGEVNDHVAYFAGEIPFDSQGVRMDRLVANSSEAEYGGVKVQHTLSRHPVGRQYADYYELVTTYVTLISTPAERADATVKARSFPLIEDEKDESVHHYTDTASSRAGIDPISRKLAIGKVAIVGAGGTGSYVLDLIAKTPVEEIHLFDGDRFSQHNAFRSPGAPSKEELRAEPRKVEYLREKYSKMHRHVVAHDYFMCGENADELKGMNFVFLCLDRADAKKAIIEKLEEFGMPFIEVGMGIDEVDGKLTGQLRTVASVDGEREIARASIPMRGEDDENDYSRNIQIADLNALNAALAVIKWKKICGFYADVTKERFSSYKVSSNYVVNADAA